MSFASYTSSIKYTSYINISSSGKVRVFSSVFILLTKIFLSLFLSLSIFVKSLTTFGLEVVKKL